MIGHLTRRIAGKVQAARALFGFYRHLEDWRPVWRAYRASAAIPSPLVLRNGLQLGFGPGDDAIQVFREIYINKCYTPHWFYEPRPGDVVIDLGANIGAFALDVGRRGARCHCFEPAADTRERLLANIAANAMSERIHVYPFGVAGHVETVPLKRGSSSIHASLYSSQQVDESAIETIEVLPLAQALRLTRETRVDLLKVDIEGAEKDLFENASPEDLAQVRRVVLEFHGHFRPGARSAAERALTAAGLAVLRVDIFDAAGESGILYAERR